MQRRAKEELKRSPPNGDRSLSNSGMLCELLELVVITLWTCPLSMTTERNVPTVKESSILMLLKSIFQSVMPSTEPRESEFIDYI